jgi:uncharacterized membrane protein YgdD (TMEM256/DUF423 family)
MDKKIVITALILGGLSIIFGAFGAHALKKVLTTDQLNSFEIGVKYQMYHALFLLFVSQTNYLTLDQKHTVLWLVLIGIMLFSGSIYLLTTTKITSLSTKIIGPFTPIGGLFLITAWIYPIFCILFKKST